METYNSLHALAATLRVSVSLLIVNMLHQLQEGTESSAIILNYAFTCLKWNHSGMQIVESLTFSGTPPPLTP